MRPAMGGIPRSYMSFTVYILYSENSNTYYIGSTANLTDRLRRHNAGRSLPTKFWLPGSLVYREEYHTHIEAVRREKQIKSYHSGEAFKKLLNLSASEGLPKITPQSGRVA